MAINFPSSPTDGQILNISSGRSFVAKGGRWKPAPLKTALPKNFIVNPSMQIAQEYTGVGTPTAASGYYFHADQWVSAWGLTGSTCSAIRQSGSAALSPITILTLGSALTPAAADYLQLIQHIEGRRITDLKWGTANAQQLVFSFLCFLTDVGPYTVSVRNGASDRSFLAPFNAPADTWTRVNIVIPGDVTGTWATDASLGLHIAFIPICGSTYGNGVAGWQSGNKISLAGSANGGRTGGNLFAFTDIGLYLDPYKTGVAPPYVLPHYAEELRRCQRYWYKQFGTRGGVASGTAVGRAGASHPAPMRVQPSISVVGAVLVWDAFAGPQVTALSNVCNEYYWEADLTTTGTFGAGGRGVVQYYQDETKYFATSARM